MYFFDNKFYLYYLITEHSCGEGFGVAVSEDGVHFSDCGGQLFASESMVGFLGTGAVWELPKGSPARFACNYSEWRDTPQGIGQNILFALSLNGSLLELYWDEWFIICYTLPERSTQIIAEDGLQEISCRELTVDSVCV